MHFYFYKADILVSVILPVAAHLTDPIVKGNEHTQMNAFKSLNLLQGSEAGKTVVSSFLDSLLCHIPS